MIKMVRLGMGLVLGCAVLLVASPVSSVADNGPHEAGAGAIADTCASCHRVHTAKATNLINEDSQLALCYTCHGATGAGSNLDVEGGVAYGDSSSGSGGALRGGGFKYALIDSAHPTGQSDSFFNSSGKIPARDSGKEVNSTHSVNSTSQTAWGNGGISTIPDYGKSIQLNCGSCHDPHGNGNYRILRPIPSGSGETSGVKIDDASTKDYTTKNYWNAGDSNAPEFIEDIGSWCSTCHTRSLSDSGSSDSGDAVFTYRHRSDGTSKGSPNCIQCHVAHGSNASMSEAAPVNWPDGEQAGTDSMLLRINNYGVCQMCHER